MKTTSYILVWANLEILAGYQDGDKEAARNWRNTYPNQDFYRSVVSDFRAASFEAAAADIRDCQS